MMLQETGKYTCISKSIFCPISFILVVRFTFVCTLYWITDICKMLECYQCPGSGNESSAITTGFSHTDDVMPGSTTSSDDVGNDDVEMLLLWQLVTTQQQHDVIVDAGLHRHYHNYTTYLPLPTATATACQGH